MAKAKIRENGHLYVIELDGKYTKKEQEMLERLGIIEIEEKPKRKKKYKNVEQKKDEKPSYEEVEKQELDEYLNEKQDGEA